MIVRNERIKIGKKIEVIIGIFPLLAKELKIKFI